MVRPDKTASGEHCTSIHLMSGGAREFNQRGENSLQGCFEVGRASVRSKPKKDTTGDLSQGWGQKTLII